MQFFFKYNIGWLSLSYGSLIYNYQLPVQSVAITTKVVSSNPAHGNGYVMQHYMIKFVSDLRYVSGFLWVLVCPTNKTDRHDITEALLKVALSTINQTNLYKIENKTYIPVFILLVSIFLLNNYMEYIRHFCSS